MKPLFARNINNTLRASARGELLAETVAAHVGDNSVAHGKVVARRPRAYQDEAAVVFHGFPSSGGNLTELYEVMSQD